jgi:hypothetical protein
MRSWSRLQAPQTRIPSHQLRRGPPIRRSSSRLTAGRIPRRRRTASPWIQRRLPNPRRVPAPRRRRPSQRPMSRRRRPLKLVTAGTRTLRRPPIRSRRVPKPGRRALRPLPWRSRRRRPPNRSLRAHRKRLRRGARVGRSRLPRGQAGSSNPRKHCPPRASRRPRARNRRLAKRGHWIGPNHRQPSTPLRSRRRPGPRTDGQVSRLRTAAGASGFAPERGSRSPSLLTLQNPHAGGRCGHARLLRARPPLKHSGQAPTAAARTRRGR